MKKKELESVPSAVTLATPAGVEEWTVKLAELRKQEGALVTLIETNAREQKSAAARSLLSADQAAAGELDRLGAESTGLARQLRTVRAATETAEARLDDARQAEKEAADAERREKLDAERDALAKAAEEADRLMLGLAHKLGEVEAHQREIQRLSGRKPAYLRGGLVARAARLAGLSEYLDIVGGGRLCTLEEQLTGRAPEEKTAA
ncbi:MAG: hypothetical protein P4L40_09825 [Terracidiphilus sp.]|nr:hypothetical protein [Terracidiphilus sp.]